MARAPRTDVGGLVYHVLNRANARAPLFEDEADYRLFTALLAEERAHVGMRLLAWCLMPNHWHLVLWPRADGDLGRFVRRLTQRHTQAWHRRHGTPARAISTRAATRRSWSRTTRTCSPSAATSSATRCAPAWSPRPADWPHGSLAQLRRRGRARLLDPWPSPRPPAGPRRSTGPRPRRSSTPCAARCSAAPRSAPPPG